MVASDTVVGLVGAGILLVALVGVFIYESQQGAGGIEDLTGSTFSVKSTGTGKLQARQGTPAPPPAMGCVPPTPCAPPATSIDLTLEGMPSTSTVKYVAYLQGGSGAYKVGALQPSGSKYAISKSVVEDHSQQTTLVVSLEAGEGGASPANPIQGLTWSITTGAAGTSLAKDNIAVNFAGDKANHTVTFRAQGSSLNVTADLDMVKSYKGLTYRGWMVTENATGQSYAFVGNLTGSSANGTISGEITGLVSGAKGDYSRFVVTLETGTPGERPGGPAVIVADYNPLEAPVP